MPRSYLSKHFSRHAMSRRTAYDGKPYTYNEFVEHYGKKDAPLIWAEARQRLIWAEAEPAADDGRMLPHRRTAYDGQPYTYQEFVHHYGEKAAPRIWQEATERFVFDIDGNIVRGVYINADGAYSTDEDDEFYVAKGGAGTALNAITGAPQAFSGQSNTDLFSSRSASARAEQPVSTPSAHEQV
jgi:hypothetical protein